MFEFDSPSNVSRDGRSTAPLSPDTRSCPMFSAHGHALITIARNPDVTVAQMAVQLRISAISVWRVIGDLVAEQMIAQVTVGEKTRYVIISDDPFLTGMSSPQSTSAVTRLYGQTA